MSKRQNLKQFIAGFPESGLHTIRLKDLLNLRADEDLLRSLDTCFPPTTIGSVTLVDQMVLLCLDELIKPKEILEVGTFQGFTTRLFLKNSAAEIIYSVDLPPLEKQILDSPDSMRILNDGDYNDDYLRDIQNNSGEVYLSNLSATERERVRLVKQDSTKIDFSKSFSGIELGFIDGGHHYDIVKSDTENTVRAMQQGVIVWHDFSSSIHSDVTRYLNERSESCSIFHVNGSLCAFQLIGF